MGAGVVMETSSPSDLDGTGPALPLGLVALALSHVGPPGLWLEVCLLCFLSVQEP